MKKKQFLFQITLCAAMSFCAISCVDITPNTIEQSKVPQRNIDLFHIYYDQMTLMMVLPDMEKKGESIKEIKKQLNDYAERGDICAKALYAQFVMHVDHVDTREILQDIRPQLVKEAKRGDWLACHLIGEGYFDEEWTYWVKQRNTLMTQAYDNEDPIALVVVFIESQLNDSSPISITEILPKLERYDSKLAAYFSHLKNTGKEIPNQKEQINKLFEQWLSEQCVRQ